MELTDQERKLRKCEKSAAKAYGSLFVGLVGFALLVDVLWQFLFLIIVAVVSALFSIYFILPCGWKRKRFLKKVATELAEVQTEHVVWLIGFGALGIGLQDKGYKIWGAICGFSGIIIFYVCAFQRARKKKLKEA